MSYGVTIGVDPLGRVRAYRVEWSVQDVEFVGTCAEFPGLSHLASTPQASLAGIQALVADVAPLRRPPVVALPRPGDWVARSLAALLLAWVTFVVFTAIELFR